MARISIIIVPGSRFGRFTVEADAGVRWNKQVVWLCRCDCGRMRSVRARNLRSGNTRSCGCLNRETILCTAPTRALKHGATARGASEGERGAYVSWANMLQRCTNPNATNFENWGGRGIKVCKRWQGKHGFAHFLADMGPRPEGLSLDRIKVNRGYSKKNCKWATDAEQARNRRCCKPQPSMVPVDFLQEVARMEANGW